MDMRELKGLEIAARCKITFDNEVWRVPSQSGQGKYKVVLRPNDDSCECEDFSLTAKPCKHIFAARIVRERDHNGAAIPLDTNILPKKKTYKQDWPSYNLAQTTEKHRFQVLLAELCHGIPQPPREKGRVGRLPVLLSNATFAAAFKVYSTFSSRRFTCDLKDAAERGYLTHAVHYNSINNYLENPDLTTILQSLIVQSSLPLRAVETTFAPDSSGFSTSRFVKWFDEKYGVEKSGRDWVKAHVISGVKTNIVTAVVIEGKDANDCPMFKPLVEGTVKSGFNVREVPADKGYLSIENLELLEKLGGTAFVPFKCNSTAGEAGSIWEKMFHYYQFKREEFLAHYHPRSNAESTFSMVKAKFRDHVRSKSDTAMKNEVLCKFLCHNICVLIQSHCELGIEPVFWADEPSETADEGPAVLPLVRPG
jgi:transposase